MICPTTKWQPRWVAVQARLPHGSIVRTGFLRANCRICAGHLRWESRMFGNHVIRQLSAYHHQEVRASEKLKIETHLRTCSRCRAAYDEIRLGALLASTLKVSPAPEAVWNELATTQQALSRRRWVPLAALAALALTVLFIAVHMTQRPRASWQVAGLPGTSQLHPGETLQTGNASE